MLEDQGTRLEDLESEESRLVLFSQENVTSSPIPIPNY